MDIKKSTVLDQVECKPSGQVFVRLLKQLTEGDVIINSEPHRFAIESGVDTVRLKIEVDHHLNKLGFPEIIREDFKRILKLYKANSE